jgi:hypothetical protein
MIATAEVAEDVFRARARGLRGGPHARAFYLLGETTMRNAITMVLALLVSGISCAEGAKPSQAPTGRLVRGSKGIEVYDQAGKLSKIIAPESMVRYSVTGDGRFGATLAIPSDEALEKNGSGISEFVLYDSLGNVTWRKSLAFQRASHQPSQIEPAKLYGVPVGSAALPISEDGKRALLIEYDVDAWDEYKTEQQGWLLVLDDRGQEIMREGPFKGGTPFLVGPRITKNGGYGYIQTNFPITHVFLNLEKKTVLSRKEAGTGSIDEDGNARIKKIKNIVVNGRNETIDDGTETIPIK